MSDTCLTCGQKVKVQSSDEGTNFYIGTERKEALLDAASVIGNVEMPVTLVDLHGKLKLHCFEWVRNMQDRILSLIQPTNDKREDGVKG